MTANTTLARRLLLASTALVATGFGSSLMAQSTISDAGVISVAAGLEGFVSATSQLGTGADFTATVTGADQTISQTDAAAISTPQTLFGNDITAETRLNQTTAEVSGATPASGTTFTGATTIDSTAVGTAVSIDAGVGIVSQQEVIDAGDVTATITTGTNSVTLNTPVVSGDLTVSGNETVADALANDAQNTINATAGGSGNVDVPVAIANLQTFTPDGATSGAVSATNTGTMSVTLGATNTDLDGDVQLDNNAIGARAGLNSAVNDLVAGSASGTALGGGLAADLDASALDAAGVISAFVADFGVASLQVIDDNTTYANIASTTTGTVSLDMQAGTAVENDLMSARGNAILSEASGNTATNRGIVTTDGINGVSTGVASAQEFTGDGALSGDPAAQANFDLSAFTTGQVSMDGGALGTAGGDLLDTAVDLSGNRIGAEATGNEALNVAATISTGSLGGAESYVAGRQTATNVDVGAVVVSGDVIANFTEIAGSAAPTPATSSSAALNNNEVFATAALNTQTNVLQNSGSSAFGASTMVGTSRQSITGGSTTALVTDSNIGLTGTANSDAIASVSNNSVLASAMGNVSTTSISNSSARFTFTR